MFRKTPANLAKLKKIAQSFNASILKLYYRASDLYRVVNDDQGLQLDFMAKSHGIRSFEGLKSRSIRVEFGTESLLVARLADIIKSKRLLGVTRTWRCSTSWSRRNVKKKSNGG